MHDQSDRKSIRIKDYNYSRPDMYFVTICAQGMECLFGDVVDGKVELNEVGEVVRKEWKNLVLKFNDIEVNRYVIMPNHMHGIVNVGAGSSRPGNVPCMFGREDPAPTKITYEVTLGRIIGYYKYQATKQINLMLNSRPTKIWQRNYYEHIIRNEKDFERIEAYITNNPINWHLDKYYKRRGGVLPPG